MGRTPSDQPRKYQIQSLWDLHHQILRLAVLGHKEKEIAELLNVTPATVGNAIHSELGKQHLTIMRGALDAETVDVAKQIQRLAPQAIQMLEELMNDKENSPANLRASVAKDLLDRAGFGAPKVIEGRFLHAHLTGEEIEELKQRARSVMSKNEDTDIDIDVQYEDVAAIEGTNT